MKNFKKIFLTILLGVSVILPSSVYALTEVKNEEELKNAIKDGGEIVLQDNITLTDIIEIKDGNVIINMNSKNITIEKGAFKIFKGKVEFTGKGTIKDVREGNSCTVWAYGSTNLKDSEYTTLNIGKDVTIDTTQWGVCLGNAVKDNKVAYGLTLNFDGKIISSGIESGGMTIFGNVKNGCSYDKKCDLTNAPVVNIGKTAYIKADGDVALYGAGIGIWNINGGSFESKSVIGIKSGKLIINDGLFTAIGDPKTGELYGNGIYSTGSSIQIENNKGYASNMEIVINGGTFNSKKGLSIYHYPPTDSNNALNSIVINGGVFNAKFELLKNDNVTIENGEFVQEVISYLKNGYVQSKDNDVYSVANILVGSGNGLLINNSSSINYIKPGEEVTISVSEMYELSSLSVTDFEGKEIEVKAGKFIMPNKLVKINAKTIPFNEVTIEKNENVTVSYTVNGKEVKMVKAGEVVNFKYDVKEGYVLKDVSVVNIYTGKSVQVKDNSFIMPEGAVEIKITVLKTGDIVETTKPIEISKDVDKEIVEDLSKVKLDNTKTGLLESVDTSKLEGVTETDKVEVSIKATLNSYDKEKNTLVFDIKPFYSINGTEKGIIPNNLLTKTIKIELPVPSSVTDTHVKVIHKSGEKVIDTKNYEIKTREDSKYITIETESFSTFELSFYTPSTVENPTTGDGSIGYILLTIISLLGLASGYGLLKHSMNK